MFSQLHQRGQVLVFSEVDLMTIRCYDMDRERRGAQADKIRSFKPA
jgi:hypothetical protein